MGGGCVWTTKSIPILRQNIHCKVQHISVVMVVGGGGGTTGGVGLPVGTSGFVHLVVLCGGVPPGFGGPRLWRYSVSTDRDSSGLGLLLR